MHGYTTNSQINRQCTDKTQYCIATLIENNYRYVDKMLITKIMTIYSLLSLKDLLLYPNRIHTYIHT